MDIEWISITMRYQAVPRNARKNALECRIFVLPSQYGLGAGGVSKYKEPNRLRGTMVLHDIVRPVTQVNGRAYGVLHLVQFASVCLVVERKLNPVICPKRYIPCEAMNGSTVHRVIRRHCQTVSAVVVRHSQWDTPEPGALLTLY